MNRVLTVLALLAGAAIMSLAAITMVASANGPTVFTVIGAVGETNRPAFDDFDDAFLKFHDRTFDRAFAVDREMLEALPQVSVSAHAHDWPRAVSASGPRLADVMALAGVSADATLTFVALDGFAIQLDAAQRAANDWVLAINAQGRQLGVGDLGPAWLIYDTDGAVATQEQESQWIWSIFVIEAE